MSKELRDNVSRVKRFNLLGTTMFIGLHAADFMLQYALVQRGWAPRLIELIGGASVDRNCIVKAPTAQLQPYYGIIYLMAFGSSLKQILNILIVLEQDMPGAPRRSRDWSSPTRGYNERAVPRFGDVVRTWKLLE